MKIFKRTLAAVACLGLVAGGASANLLGDAGFESGAFADPSTGVGEWLPFADGSAGNVSQISAITPRTGANHAEVALVNPNGFGGFFQDVSSPAGETVDWSLYAADILGNGGAGIEVRIEFRDSVNDVEIGRTANLVPTLTGTDYALLTVTDIVPAGADLSRVVFAVQTFGATPPQQIFVDDASVTVTPEPTSLALLGLGGLALIARRRQA